MAFYGANAAHQGIYLQNFLVTTDLSQTTLEVVCDQSTGLPTIGTPTSFNEIPCIAEGGVYFAVSNGTTQGIYKYNISTKEIGEIYVCAASETLSQFSASGGRVTFEKSNAVNANDNGIWLIKNDNLAVVIIKTGLGVQINNYPMDENYTLSKTGAPFLDGENLAFVGELKNNATNVTGQALVRYNLIALGLLAVLKDGDTLPNGNQLVGGTPFKSPLAFSNGLIATKVEYNTSNHSSTYHMVIGIDAQNNMYEVAKNDSKTHNGSLFTNEFALFPMTSGGRIAFVSDVELASDKPSTNLFGYNVIGGQVLETWIEGFTFPYSGKSYLQSMDHVGGSFSGNMIAARCFWNNGQSDNEDLLGVYAFFI
jgi:hypothetical protein